MPPPDKENSLEFPYADLNLRGKVDADKIVEAIHKNIVEDTSLSESDIVGVQLYPKFWTQKVYIFCAFKKLAPDLS